MSYVQIGLRCLVGVVFLVAVAGKVYGRTAFGGFAASVRRMVPMPAVAVRPVAVAVVASELAVCVLLATPVRPAAEVGFALAGGLLVVFGAAIALAVRRGTRTPCRCFGASVVPLGHRHVVRNLALAAVSGAGWLTASAPGTAHPGGFLVAAVTGLVLGTLVAMSDDIVSLFQPVGRH